MFEWDDTAKTFGRWLFTVHHKYCKTVCHNMNGGFFLLLEYLLINQSMRLDTNIYNGSKSMYVTVEKDLYIKVIDSLNFFPMKLAALPKAFGLKELKKAGSLISSSPELTYNTLAPTLAPAFTGVSLWEQIKEKNVCPGFTPKMTPSSVLDKKCWNIGGVTWTYLARRASCFETYQCPLPVRR